MSVSQHKGKAQSPKPKAQSLIMRPLRHRVGPADAIPLVHVRPEVDLVLARLGGTAVVLVEEVAQDTAVPGVDIKMDRLRRVREVVQGDQPGVPPQIPQRQYRR